MKTKKDGYINIRMDSQSVELLKEKAESEDRTLSSYCRRIIEKHLEESESNKNLYYYGDDMKDALSHDPVEIKTTTQYEQYKQTYNVLIPYEK